MNTLLVGYDLNREGQDYDDLIKYLKSDVNWWHHLDSTWLVRTEKSPQQLRDDLRSLGYIDGNDEVLVIDVTGRASAWYGFKEKGSNWLKENL